VRKTGADPSTLRELRSVTVAREHVSAYAAVCGFPVKDTVPLSYPHVLAFPLHLAVLSSPRFPFPAIGTLHIANRISQRRPIGIGEALLIDVSSSPIRQHPKGRAVDLVATARVRGETVWESTSTYLRRGGTLSPSPTGEEGGPTDEPSVVSGRITWRLGGDLGRRYAAVSGDHNPIHLYPLTAKALGQPRQIAHGMWSLARCIAALENRLPDAVTVEASFTRPILLPGAVAFGQVRRPEADGGGIGFALTSPQNGAPHVVGRTRAIP
jgi:hypothetical protein